MPTRPRLYALDHPGCRGTGGKQHDAVETPTLMPRCARVAFGWLPPEHDRPQLPPIASLARRPAHPSATALAGR